MFDINRPSLPTTIDGIRERLAHFRTEAGNAYANAFEPRSDDVLIATYPKSGTTWMQQIVHGLRTGGDMDFSEITEVVPWIEMAHDMGFDLTADHRGNPRAFKTHWSYDEIPEGCKSIYIMRNPYDVAVSMYHFFEGWFFEPGSIDFDSFVRAFFLEGSKSGTYWEHVASWWPNRGRDDVLFLTYEDMRADHAGIVRKVDAFIGTNASPEVLDIATRQSTATFMGAHETCYDDHILAAHRNGPMGLPAHALSTKVRDASSVGSKARVVGELADLLDQRWTEEMTGRFGFVSYDEMRAALQN